MNKNLMRQAQQLQSRLQKAQEELETATVEGTAGGEAINVTMTGKQRVLSVEIASELLEDLEMLQDLVAAAVNNAVEKSQKLASQKMGSITGGIKIPGLI